MNTFLATVIAVCAPLVHPTTMRALIAVESAGNPYAVSINRPGHSTDSGTDLPLYSQPHSAEEARQLVRTLHAAGYTTSVGLAQINTEHLAAWQLPLAALLDPCTNLRLAQRVLLDCDRTATRSPARSAAIRLAQTLSCFNSGDVATGLANGYADRVHRAALSLTAVIPTRSSIR